VSARELALDLMGRFAERAGLDGDRAPRRYLWTDAFAVCNYLSLWRETGELRFRQLAVELVDQVHRVLGRHRADDPRRGWISGLGAAEGARHPTRGGLRIGKPLPERAPHEAFDERLEWERDGQYFHYLTRWMHALDQVARRTGEPRYNRWARELAETAHRAFAVGPPRGRHMVWKRSIDLSRELVSSMGQHDPLDGLVACLQLRATAAALPGAKPEPGLDAAVDEFARLVAPDRLATSDPLGLGGLLVDAARVAQLTGQGAGAAHGDLVELLLAAAEAGLAVYEGQRAMHGTGPLAFRELGLAMGLGALVPLEQALKGRERGGDHGAGLARRLEALAARAALGTGIVSTWTDPARRRRRDWIEHEDINDVMLATCLVPDGWLVLEPVGPRDAPPPPEPGGS